MPRRKAAVKRERLPDPLYQSELVEKLINVIMREGKKAVAQKIVYRSLESLSGRIKKEHKSDDEGDGDGSKSSGGKSSRTTKKTDTAKSASQHEEALELLLKALGNIAPPVEVKSRRVGGATYQVPVEVPKDRGLALAMRWLVEAAKDRSGKTMAEKLSDELYDAYRGHGSSIKKRLDMIRMADANKAFAHFRW